MLLINADHHLFRGFLPEDMYHFNNQHRRVNSKRPTSTPAPEECEDYCAQMQEGMRPERDPGGWTKIIMSFGANVSICSHKEVYEDLDDM